MFQFLNPRAAFQKVEKQILKIFSSMNCLLTELKAVSKYITNVMFSLGRGL